MEIAKTILQQLGGKRFIAMTGAKNFGIVAEGNGIGFSIPRKNNIKYIRIVLNNLDLYDVEFLNTKIEVVNKTCGLYAEDLQPIFMNQTGLATSL